MTCPTAENRAEFIIRARQSADEWGCEGAGVLDIVRDQPLIEVIAPV